ncbi:MAG: hypothetical protein IH908_09010, partial [Proteobacteria bacterium]|nr:hypothetical protein [Pseudomonadota bacterium]
MTYVANEPLERWLSKESPEEVLEPDLPIVDPHHHLWDIRSFTIEPVASFEQKVYLCEEIVNDIRESEHNVVQTVFAQCGAFYRADGPEPMRCVGETEFVHGIFAMSNSGIYGDIRLCTGIFGSADLRAGTDVEPVIQAHLAASPNFRGVRTAFPSDLNDEFMAGYAILAKYGLCFDSYSPKSMPLVNSLYLGGVPPIENLTLQPPREDAPKTQLFLDWQRDHPLLRYVALDDILFTDADRLTLPDTALTLATGLGGPVIAEVSHEGVRHIVSSFDILNSNWPAHYNFPVLISNAIEWLGLGGQTHAGIGYLPGQVALVPLSGEAQEMPYDWPGGLSLTAALRRV